MAKENKELGHGVLTAAIIDGLKTGLADRDNDGRVSGFDLFSWCADYAKRHGSQKVVMSGQAESRGVVVAYSSPRLAPEVINRLRVIIARAYTQDWLKRHELDPVKEYFLDSTSVIAPPAGSLADRFLAHAEGRITLSELLSRPIESVSSRPPPPLPPEPPKPPDPTVKPDAESIISRGNEVNYRPYVLYLIGIGAPIAALMLSYSIVYLRIPLLLLLFITNVIGVIFSSWLYLKYRRLFDVLMVWLAIIIATLLLVNSVYRSVIIPYREEMFFIPAISTFMSGLFYLSILTIFLVYTTRASQSTPFAR